VSKKKFKVIWSVDLFEERTFKDSQLVVVLRRIAESLKAEIEPIYVLSPNSLDLAVEFSPPWIKTYRPAAQKSLRLILQDVKFSGLLESRVLLQAKPSLVSMVKTLVNYAKNGGADLIVMGTHSRTGLSRLFLGSFAETTLIYAKIPVMLVGPHSESKDFKKILFATDFGNKSGAVFKKVLLLVKNLGAALTLFHSISDPIGPIIQSGAFLLGGGWVDLPEYMTQVEETQRKVAKRWQSEAMTQNIEVNVVFIPSGGRVSDSIVEASKTLEVGLITMAAESSPLASALIGSISRQVVRNAHCPVWLFRA
jgi:nucleotide-binding universal stress UspA family protein